MDYLFINAAIKAKSRELLTSKEYQMFQTLEKEKFAQTLFDFGYGYSKKNLILPVILAQEEEKKINQLQEWLSLDHYLLRCYLLLKDLTNIKIYLKNDRFLNNTLNGFSEVGLYSFQAIERAFKYQDFSLVENDKELFVELTKISNNLSPFSLSNQVTKTFANYIFQKYAHCHQLLKEYCQVKFTALNVLSTIRFRKMNFDINLFTECYLENSLLEKDDFLEFFYQQDITIFQKKLSYEYAKFFVPFTSINELQLNFDKMLIQLAQKFENDTESLGTILGYLVRKKYEIINIKKLYYQENVTINELLVI